MLLEPSRGLFLAVLLLPGWVHATLVSPAAKVSAPVHAAFPAFGVQVLDANQQPAPQVDVTFLLSGPGGQQVLVTGGPSETHVTTDSQGMARFPRLVYGYEPSVHSFHVSTAQLGSTDIEVDVVDGPRPARIEIYSGDGQTPPADTALPQPFAVRVFGTDGAPMAGSLVTFIQHEITAATAGGWFDTPEGLSTADDLVAADANGVARSASPFLLSILSGTAIVTAQVFRGYETGDSASIDFMVHVGPPSAGSRSTFQDMWWGGDAENGWGISIIEHENRLFPVIFAYDPAGNPTWFVVPDAHWEFGAGLLLEGNLYSPTGTPYSATQSDIGLVVGFSKGQFSIDFVDGETADAHLSIYAPPPGGVLPAYISKRLKRMQYAPVPAQGEHGISDMWWGGGSQAGWGVSVLEQSGALFSVWYTYGPDRNPLWFVMPGGSWVSGSDYSGSLYTTSNPTWWTQYDPSKLAVTHAGTYNLHITDPAGAMRLDYVTQRATGSLRLSHEPF